MLQICIHEYAVVTGCILKARVHGGFLAEISGK